MYSASLNIDVSNTASSGTITINDTSPRINYYVNVSGNISDADNNVHWYWFSHNMTGTVFGTNTTPTSLGISLIKYSTFP